MYSQPTSIFFLVMGNRNKKKWSPFHLFQPKEQDHYLLIISKYEINVCKCRKQDSKVQGLKYKGQQLWPTSSIYFNTITNHTKHNCVTICEGFLKGYFHSFKTCFCTEGSVHFYFICAFLQYKQAVLKNDTCFHQDLQNKANSFEVQTSNVFKCLSRPE